MSTNEYQALDALGLKFDVDKSSKLHNYTEVYTRYFEPLRDKPIKFLEIGIEKGNSVKLWEEYFRNGELHFIDIDFEQIQYFSERSRYHYADQENPEELQKFIKNVGTDFDIIIDDGGHIMNQQIVSFRQLFPHVKKGGMYIIEDLHTSYWKKFRRKSEKTTISFLKGLIDDLNYLGAKTRIANHRAIHPFVWKDMKFYQKEVESIHFYDSLAIVLKR